MFVQHLSGFHTVSFLFQVIRVKDLRLKTGFFAKETKLLHGGYPLGQWSVLDL